jgi:hypothetical protein
MKDRPLTNVEPDSQAKLQGSVDIDYLTKSYLAFLKMCWG